MGLHRSAAVISLSGPLGLAPAKDPFGSEDLAPGKGTNARLIGGLQGCSSHSRRMQLILDGTATSVWRFS